ncbi:MAG: hypothetical protein ACM3JD_08060, partial [Rudaea sp.]
KHQPIGFIQARMRRGRPEADISFISPSLEAHPDGVAIWYRLLSELTNILCEKGCQRVYTQALEDGDAEQVLHQAGFTVYAHEDVYLLSAERLATYAPPIGPRVLRRQRSRDSWNLLRLYHAATPRPVQLAEGMVSGEGKPGMLGDWWEQASGAGYVLDAADGTLAGAVRLTRGRAANWLRIHLHPAQQDKAGELVCATLSLVNTGRRRAVYCGVRDYEGGIRGPLEDSGLKITLRRSLLVKHATVRVKEPAAWAVPVLEKPTPIVRTHSQAREGRKERAPRAAG